LLSSTAQVMSHPACIVEAEYTEPAWDPGEYKPGWVSRAGLSSANSALSSWYRVA